MDEKLYKILKKIYIDGYRNHRYEPDWDRDGVRIYSVDDLREEEKAYITESNFEVNNIQKFTHDDVVKRLIEIKNHEKLSMRYLTNYFISGVSGSFPRGIQPIMSFLYARNIIEHKAIVSRGSSPICDNCELNISKHFNISEDVFRLYFGYAWNEIPVKYLIDLEEFITLSEIVQTEKDKEIFRRLLLCIDNANEKETVGQLEKRIKAEKILTYKDKYIIRGILMVLAELGVMPNAYIKPMYDGFTSFSDKCAINTKGSMRSDIVLPLAGWNGSLKINRSRVFEVFELD